MSLLHELEGKWRLNASYCDKDGLVAKVLCRCADELATALAAGYGAVAWTSQNSLDMLSECGSGIMGASRTDYVCVPLFTHPAGAVQVTDEAIERALDAVAFPGFSDQTVRGFLDLSAINERAFIRSLLAAALNPGGSRE